MTDYGFCWVSGHKPGPKFGLRANGETKPIPRTGDVVDAVLIRHEPIVATAPDAAWKAFSEEMNRMDTEICVASWPDAKETCALTGMEPICIFDENQPWMADPERNGVVCAFVGGQVIFVGYDELEDHPWSHGATYDQWRGEGMRATIIRKAKALARP